MNVYEPVIAVMRRHSCTCSPEEFHAAVNIAFHEYEAEVFDEIHKDRWQLVPKQVELLVDDWLAKCARVPEYLNVLDVGCGTGLASDSLLKTRVGHRIRSIDLLDTSKSMLLRAADRAKAWPVPNRQFLGPLVTAPAGQHYDVVIASSVLHHVPDLPGFFRNVRSRQQPGGIFIHVEDPNADYLTDPELKRRTAEVSSELPAWVQRLHPRRILGRLQREMTGRQGLDYISKTNRALITQGLIKEPLTVTELFAIIDIHVHSGSGISIKELRGLLSDYELLGQRSCGFFGDGFNGRVRFFEQLPHLPKEFEIRETELIAAGALNGFNIGAIWRVRL